jgi:hypothetical protein
VGEVLNKILGYLGTGEAVLLAAEDEGDSRISAFAAVLNAGLDFTFNRMHFGPLSLDAQTIYTRGSYDAAAKSDTYGLKVTGLFPGKPFGFSLEGGYKHFFAFHQWFEKDYPGTGYFNGSIFFPLKHITLGMIYRYDNIYKSKFTLAVSTNFLSGFYTFNPVEQYMDKDKFSGGPSFDMGARFRWGGWNAGKEK